MNHCSFANAIAISGSIVRYESQNRRDRFLWWSGEKRLITQSASGWSLFSLVELIRSL
jgi:hypothetical protein